MEIERITPEEIKKLIEKASDTEMRYLLILQLQTRSGGCGHLYTYNETIELIYGKAEFVTLESSQPEECLWREKILVIPYTVPVIVRKGHRDKNPEVSNFDEFFIFTGSGWKEVRVELPK